MRTRCLGTTHWRVCALERLFAGSLLLAICAALALPRPALGAPSWESIGPNGGDLLGLEVSPSDPATMYALSFLSVYRSTDSAASWAPIHEPEMGVGLLSLAFDPSNSDHVFVGTATTGVWDSSDAGATWTNCTTGLPAHASEPTLLYPIVSLVSLPNGDLLAGLQQVEGAPDPPAWIYRSTNGCSWTPHDDGVAFEPGSLTQAIAALLSLDSSGFPWAMIYGAGVYRHGANEWVEANGDLPAEAIHGTFLAHDPTLAGHLWLGTERDWIYESWNAGASWSAVNLPVALQQVSPLPLVYDIAIDPSNPDFVYAFAHDASTSGETPIFTASLAQVGGGGGYLSNNGGVEWPLLPIPAFARVAIDPAQSVTTNLSPFGVTTRSKRWYASSYGENNLRTSSDGLETVGTSNTGLASVLVNAVWLHPNPAAPHDRLLLSAAEEGIRLRVDDGPTWDFTKAASSTIYTWSFASDPTDPTLVYYSTGHPARLNTLDRGVYRSSLECLGESCPPAEQLLADVGVWKILSTPLQPHTLYAATQEQGVLASDDRGATWTTMNEGLPLPAGVTDLTLSDLGDPLIAGTRTHNGDITGSPPQPWLVDPAEAGALYRRAGSVWVASPDVTAAVYGLAADPGDASHALAATAAGVYETTDGGATWGLLYALAIATDVLIDPLRPDYYYASSPQGVLRSTDGGGQWHFLPDGLYQSFALSLDIDPRDGTLFAGTLGGGVFQLSPDPNPQPKISVEPAPLLFDVTPVGLAGDVVATLVNVGEANLTVTAINANDPAFSLADTTLPITLTPGSSAPVGVRFSPSSSGIVNATLYVASNDPAAPVFPVSVSGEGRAAIPPTLDLLVNGSRNLSLLASGSSATVTANVSAGDFTGEMADVWLKLVRPDGTIFWLEEGNGWVESVSPIRFRASPIVDASPFLTAGVAGVTMGTYQLVLVLDEGDGVFEGTWITGTTLTFAPSPPAAAVSPASLAFGQVAMGSSAGQGFGIVNSGEEDLVVTGIDIPILELEFITPSPIFPLTVASQSATVVTLRFTPSAEQLYTAAVVIHSNDPTQPNLSVPVTGQGGFTDFPMPNGLLDGADGPLHVDEGELVEFSANLSAGDFAGQDADFWVRRTLPNGTTQWLVEPVGWVTSVTPARYRSAALTEQTPLFTTLLADAPRGQHELFFAIDDNADGAFDATWSDTETLVVPEPSPLLSLIAGGALCCVLRRARQRAVLAR